MKGAGAMNDETREDKQRMEVLKGIIKDLHAGVDVSILKQRFAELVKDVGPDEIPRLEQELIKEGMPQEEITRLCDVHVQLFKESLERQDKPSPVPGHPIHTLGKENRALDQTAHEFKKLLEDLGDPPSAERYPALAGSLAKRLDDLAQVEKHYVKKENLLFPFLEKHGITGPPQVMWTIHDQVRALGKRTREAMNQGDLKGMAENGKELARVVSDMVYKEDNILFPMSLKTLTEDEWVEVRKGEAEIGYALIIPGDEWEPGKRITPKQAAEKGTTDNDLLELEVGALSREQVNLLLTHLNADLTFVDEDDVVRYYSAGKERIFPRSPAVIGRKVQMCHPPKSIHLVNRILEAFKTGAKDEADFWLNYQGRFIYIIYRAVRDKDGNYRGCLEITQNASEIKKLEGERRLPDW
jgi:DUF438 domain-containing protein